MDSKLAKGPETKVEDKCQHPPQKEESQSQQRAWRRQSLSPTEPARRVCRGTGHLARSLLQGTLKWEAGEGTGPAPRHPGQESRGRARGDSGS